MNYSLRKAEFTEAPLIWNILQQAILRRKQAGSLQWQDGYPNPDSVKRDLEKGVGYVLVDDTNAIAGYSAILVNDEPAYDDLKGNWLSNGDFLVVHRVAISEEHLGKGLAQKMFLLTEEMATKQGIFSIKMDTNFDNTIMLHLLDKLGYVYCGEVVFRGGVRMAFEKVLDNKPLNG